MDDDKLCVWIKRLEVSILRTNDKKGMLKNWKEQRINQSEMVDFCGEVPGDGHNPGVTMGGSSCSWIEEKKMLLSQDQKDVGWATALSAICQVTICINLGRTFYHNLLQWMWH